MHTLDLSHYQAVLHKTFSDYPRRDFSIQCILEGTMCQVISDHLTHPDVFLIKNGSFNILGGNPNNANSNSIINSIPTGTTIHSTPEPWIRKIKSQANLTLQTYHRYSFDHASVSIRKLDNILVNTPSSLTLKAIDTDLATRIGGHERFAYHFQNYHSQADFLNKGLGFVALYKDTIVGVVSSALVCSSGYETSIMVLPEYRGKSIGKLLAASFIRAALLNNKVPHWDAANEVSLNLATTLGYTLIGKYPAQKLIKL